MDSDSQRLRLWDLLKQVGVYGTGDVFLKVTAVVTVPIYTRIFTPDQYGAWNVIVTIGGLFTTLLTFGGNTTYCRFFFDAKTAEEKRLVTSTWCIFLSLWSVSATGICVLLSSALSQWSLETKQYSILFELCLAGVPIGLINETCGQVLRNEFRAKLFSALNIVSGILTVGFSIYGAVGLDLGLLGVMGGALIAAIVMLPVRLWAVRSMLRPCFSLTILKRMLFFGMPLVPTTLAYWVFGLSDRVLLGKLSTLDQVGLYGIAASVAGTIGMVNGALGQAWGPIALKMYEEDREAASRFFGRVMTYILLGFGLACVFVTIFAEEVLMILSAPAFYPASAAVGPLALGIVASSSVHITALSISLRMKTKYFAYYSWVAAVLNLILNCIFIPKWGMIAASWATAASYTFLTLAYFVTSQRLWAIRYEGRQILLIVASSIGFTIGVTFMPDLGYPWGVLCKVLYFLVSVFFMSVLGGIDLREWCGLLAAKGYKGITWLKVKP